LDDNVSIILAGNETSAAGAQTLLTPILNRCTLIHSEADLEYWTNEYALPNNICTAGVSFLNNNLYKKFFQEEESSDPFGSARSWTSVFNNISELESLPYYKDDFSKYIKHVAIILQGSVSKEASSVFLDYYMLFRNIDVKSIFENKSYIIPTDPVEKYAMSIAVTQEFINRYYNNEFGVDKIYSAFITNLSINNMDSVISAITYLVRIPANVKDSYDSGKNILLKLIKDNVIDRELAIKITKESYSIGL
jgi:hypothetical protein